MLENEDSLPRLLGGRYRLEAKLGSGGMGVVYRATDLSMQRAVAVKLIRSADGIALDEEVAGRFLREAKNTARIQHENIIEVFDLGRSDQGDMYFVMELLEGESLSAKIRRDGKIEPPLAVHIARQVCAALHVAHTAGIIHRDLKPANVMLLRRGSDPFFVKVLDFGVAKSYAPDQETQLTHTGMLVGTVEYMAPEQIMGRPVDGRTDLYALGIVLYRMLTGKAPFRDGGVPALIHAHLNVFPKPLSEVNPAVPGELDRAVLRCLAKQPEQRYESMEELGRALAAAMPAPLVDLEYHDDEDIYNGGERTEVARPAILDSEPEMPVRRLPRVQMDSESMEVAEAFDDSTVKMDRVDHFDPASLPTSLPKRTERLGDSGDRTAIMIREELATEKRSVPDQALRAEATATRACAMCHTKNPPHARACSACGVSLSMEEQEAVRARVSAPRAVQHHGAPPMQMPGPMMPPPGTPVSGVGAVGQGMPFAQSPPGHPQQMASGTGWHQRPPPQSVWQRFLSWTGLR